MRLCQNCIEKHWSAKDLVSIVGDFEKQPCDHGCKCDESAEVIITYWADTASGNFMTKHDWREFFLLLHRFIVALDDWICNKFKLSRKAKGKHE